MTDMATLLPEHRYSGWELFGGTSYSEAFLDTGDDAGSAPVAGFAEYLDWHMSYAPELMQHLTEGDEDDRWLTPEALEAVGQVVLEHLPEHVRNMPYLNLEVTDEAGGDDPNFTVTIELPVDDDSDGLINLTWTLTATVANLSDPGTFGVPYLFNEVARRLGMDPNYLPDVESE